jgi:hypothetical protein
MSFEFPPIDPFESRMAATQNLKLKTQNSSYFQRNIIHKYA